MNENGHKVLNVVIGASFTDIDCLDENYVFEKDANELIDCPFYVNSKNGKEKIYSDVSKRGQYVVYKDGKRVFIEPERLDEQSVFYGRL